MISKSSSGRRTACRPARSACRQDVTRWPAAACWAVGLVLSWAVTASAEARPPRAERVADRMAERRYARLSIAEARVAEAESRAARAEARVAQIAPAVPVPPPPRPATMRRMARAGVPLGGPTPPAAAARPPVPPRAGAEPAAQASAQAAPQPMRQPAPPQPAAAGPAVERGAWTLGAEDAVAPATAEVAPDGTRSVLSAGGGAGQPAAAGPSGRPDPAVTQPPVELLPTPEAKQ
jgi:hypothetical protein